MTKPPRADFFQDGWTFFDHDPRLMAWVRSALPVCREMVASEQHAKWLRHNDTWFVGVNALNNDGNGRLVGGPALDGTFTTFLDQQLGLRKLEWDRAQISVLYPGYPGFSGDESEAAHHYRLNRDAAHIDGLLRVGKQRRRFLLEHHAFILGIPVVPFPENAAPFVVWRGSHNEARKVFEKELGHHPAALWHEIDLTDIYHALRRRIFERCERVELHVEPGQCFLAHRLSLHGMAPWSDAAAATEDGRMMCYFRPALHNVQDWLSRP